MPDIEFRTALLADTDAIAQLVNAAYRPARGEGGWTHESDLVAGNRTSPPQVAAMMDTSTILVGFMDGQLVACANIAKEGNEAHIGMLAVTPKLQGTGVGKILLAQAEKYAALTLKAEQLILLVVGARQELIEFYLRRGYAQTGFFLDYPVHAGVGNPIHGSLKLEVLQKPATH